MLRKIMNESILLLSFYVFTAHIREISCSRRVESAFTYPPHFLANLPTSQCNPPALPKAITKTTTTTTTAKTDKNVNIVTHNYYLQKRKINSKSLT